MNDHVHALPEGYRLQEYAITGMLGFGGFGITYSALDTNLDKTIAIKEYLPSELAVRGEGSTVSAKSEQDRGSFDWGLERFLEEAKTVAKFDHPNIVRIFRFFKQNGTGYIVMEFIEGRTLSSVLKEQGTLEESEIRAWLWPVMEGLKIVHSAGYLHRDIKPPNIMLRDDGRPCLLDFGAARMAMGGKTRSLTAIMTPGFAPLEQYQTRGRQGPWTDIYSLGAVMYGCISGRKPMDALDRISDDTMKSPDEKTKRTYSKGLIRGIVAALTMCESERPQSIDALLDIMDKPEEEPTGRITEHLLNPLPIIKQSEFVGHGEFDEEISTANKSGNVKKAGFSITASPKDVSIFIDDAYRGIAPLDLIDLNSGEMVKIAAVKAGFEAEYRSECVPADHVIDLVFTLGRVSDEVGKKPDIAESIEKEPTQIMRHAPKPQASVTETSSVRKPPLTQQNSEPKLKSKVSESEVSVNDVSKRDFENILLGIGKWLIVIVGVLALSTLGWFKWTDDISEKQKTAQNATIAAENITERNSRNSTGTGFSFTVVPHPADAEIKILNIKPTYHPGMLLEPGRYEVEVSKAGFKTKRQRVEIRDRNFRWEIFLVKN